MELFERLFGLLLAAAMVMCGIDYFKEYRYDMGRWVAAGMLVFGLIIVAGCITELYAAYREHRALEVLCSYSRKNRRLT